MRRKVLALLLVGLLGMSCLTPAVGAADEADVLLPETVIRPQFEEAHYFPRTENGNDAGLALVKSKGKYGYIDTKGKVVIPCTYDVAFDFHDGYAVVGKSFCSTEDRVYYELSLVNESGAYISFPTPADWHVLGYSYYNTWDDLWYDMDPAYVREGYISLTLYFARSTPNGGVEVVEDERYYEGGQYGFSGNARLYQVKNNSASLMTLHPLPSCNSLQVLRMGAVGDGMVFLLVQIDDKSYPIPEEFSSWGGMLPMYYDLENGTYVTVTDYEYFFDSGDEFRAHPWGFYGTFDQGLAPVRGIDGGCILINKQGQLAIDACYNSFSYSGSDFQIFGDNGLAVVERTEYSVHWTQDEYGHPSAETTWTTLYGAINKSGQLVIPLVYDELLPATDGTDRFPFRKGENGAI